MENRKLERIAIGSLVISGACLVGGIYLYKSNTALKNMLSTTTSKIANNIDVDIPERLLTSAIEHAVDSEVKRAVRETSLSSIRSIKSDISRGVERNVYEAIPDIRAAVTKELTRQVRNIDVDVLKKEVRDEAKEAIVDKFNDNLDDLLSQFNENLINVSKIYSSLSDSLMKKD